MKKSDTQFAIYEDYPTDSINLETFYNPLWWQLRGLMYTATGYGKKIPTEYMVKHNNRLKRVYCCIFSNNGTLYIKDKGLDLIVHSS